MKRRLAFSLLQGLAVVAEPTLAGAAEPDVREVVNMPAPAREALRAEMRDFQLALHLIVGALGESKFADAAEIAETQIGMPAMGRHRKEPVEARPGTYMPEAMNSIGRDMHRAGSEFARIARKGNTAQALLALQAVTGACVACHQTYRTH